MFSDELRKLRKQKKLNQASLAEAVGMSQATVAAWENGTRKPDVETISFLADYFGVTVDYLMGREEPAKDGAEAYPPHLQEAYRVLSDLTPQELAEVVEVAKFKLYQRDQNK